MGEVVGLVTALVVCSVAGAWIAVQASERRRRAELARTPPITLGPDGTVSAERARESYRVAQQAVRVLEGLVRDDMVRVVIPEAQRTEIVRIVQRFYDL